MAYAKRLIALRLARKLDAEIAARRKSGAREPAAGVPSRQRLEELRAEAFSSLDQAEEIYRSHHHHRGLGTVRLDRGFLFLDAGDLALAEVEGDAAYELGPKRRIAF